MAKALVVFTQEAWDWIRGFTNAVNTEIGGFGYVTSPEKDMFVVDTIYLAPQEVSGGGVHFDDGAMGWMVEKAIQDDRLNDARFSWHSHNTMNCYWSATDEEGITDYKETGMPWLISAVVNQKGEAKVRIDIFDSIMNHITIDNVEYRIGLPDPGLAEAIDQEIKALVRKKTYTPIKPGGDTSKHRPAGSQTQPRALPPASGNATSDDWWDEIDWATIGDAELTKIMREHGFNVDDAEDEVTPTKEDEKTAEQMAKIEAAH